MDMDFIVEDPSGVKLHFPVNPSEVNIRRDRSLETVTIVSGDEIDLPQGVKIKEISFSSFFPFTYDSSYCRYPDLPDPQDAMNQLNTWLEGRMPLRLFISGTAVNVLVILSAHNSSFRGGEPGDVYFDVTFRTWRGYQIRTLTERLGTSGSNRVDIKPNPATYVVKSGDSLWRVSKQLLGAGSRWPELYQANRQLIGPNPDLIFPGQELVIPG